MRNPERNQKFHLKIEPKPKIIISKEALKKQNFLSTDDLFINDADNNENGLSSNSRCVPVGTKMNAPDGRKKKEMFKAKRVFVKFRCSVYEKKLLQVKAKRSGLSLSEFIRRAALEMEIKERLSEDHLDIYKNLVKFHNNFKSIGNMFRKKDPKLSEAVYKLAADIKLHLQRVEK